MQGINGSISSLITIGEPELIGVNDIPIEVGITRRSNEKTHGEMPVEGYALLGETDDRLPKVFLEVINIKI